jgi:hypothetical protein
MRAKYEVFVPQRCDLMTLEAEASMLSSNIRYQIPSDTASRARRTDATFTSLLKPYNLHGTNTDTSILGSSSVNSFYLKIFCMSVYVFVCVCVRERERERERERVSE